MTPTSENERANLAKSSTRSPDRAALQEQRSPPPQDRPLGPAQRTLTTPTEHADAAKRRTLGMICEPMN